MERRFKDRSEAGRMLAERLGDYRQRDDVVVLALPRGGVPVGLEVARALNAPLDTFVVRKLGVPGHEELAMGAIASGGVRIINDEVVRELGIGQEAIARVANQELAELSRRERSYRGERGTPDLNGKIAILVDDGLATGSTMRAAVAALRGHEPARIVIAVPVGAPAVCNELGKEADEIVCTLTPEPMSAISMWYETFDQTSDDEVRNILGEAAREISETRRA